MSMSRQPWLLAVIVWLASVVCSTAALANSIEGWQRCTLEQADPLARLACFDRWARARSQPKPSSAPTLPAGLQAPQVASLPPDASTTQAAGQGLAALQTPQAGGHCRAAGNSGYARFWELDADSDCGTFTILGYKPISLSWTGANTVNTQPASPSPEHTAASALAYDHNETRIQLSVRTKIAQGLLTGNDLHKRDSLWFGYSQHSYWQLFNSDLSRPFRSTDHEPELMYIYPSQLPLGPTWRLSFAGLSLNHQSNGQSLPLSRSWNRTILMAGFENGNGLYVQARLWQRVPEQAADDDNPDIARLVGRGELSAFWASDASNTWGLTWRHSLRAQANGSIRLEWLRSLPQSWTPAGNGLRLHTQLFSGYGDSLLDYNRRRTVLSVGLSLVDW
jgi:phospholipase A1